MCEPATIFMAASSGMAIANFIGGQQQMKKQTASTIKSQEIQQDQLVEQANMNSFSQGIAARKQQAKIVTAAGDVGVTGNSVAAQLLESMFNEGQNDALATQNLENSVESSVAERNSRLSGISAPSLLNTGLQIGAAYGRSEMYAGDSRPAE